MEIRINILKTQIKLASDLYRTKQPYHNDGMRKRIDNLTSILEATMSDVYKTKPGKYENTISIFKEAEKDGVKTEKVVHSFGLEKAKAILAQIEEIKAFVEANKKDEVVEVDETKLNSEQQNLVSSFIKK